MRIFHGLVLISTIALVAGCRAQQTAAPQGPGPAGTLREIMHGIVEYQAFVLFNAVTVTITATGVDEREPRTDEEWDVVQHAALTLAESANLLTVPGRRIASPEEEDTSAGPGELTPLQIHAKIDANPDLWLSHVNELQAVGLEALKITTDRDVQGLFDIGEKIDGVCERCHMEFWYPEETAQ